MVPYIGGGREPKPTYKTGAEVGNDIPLKIGKNDHIEILGPDYQLHGQVIDDDIVGFQIGIFFCHLLEALEKEPVCQLHDVGLMAAGNAFCSLLLCHLEGVLDHLKASRPCDESPA